MDLQKIQNPFFIGIAGSGMSALAQYLQGTGKNVSGSDRFFSEGKGKDIRAKLEAEGIRCFPQDATGITDQTDVIIASTAIEDSVAELVEGKRRGIPVMRRSELLALIAESRKTIAVGGTSGKSTTSAMLFTILEYAGLDPSIISGAGLVGLIRQGRIGNAKVGKGEWLVIEADESDGSIVQYKPEIGLLLNVDKDHQELSELVDIFTIFRNNSRKFIVNRSQPLAAKLSTGSTTDFGTEINQQSGFTATGFKQEGLEISFTINGIPFQLHQPGRHNMENALAAAAVAAEIGVPLKKSAEALRAYEGIYRRNQVLGQKNGVWLIDDYAHNPVKCAAAIRACQPVAQKVVAWFQPHGYKPTKFLRKEFVDEISAALREQDEIWMSEIFYAGGTATKDISANDLVEDIKATGKNAYFVERREEFLIAARPHLTPGTVLLLMAARDPSLEEFAASVWRDL
jgi:UDP-N-acetylmuramate--alanine ligase